MAAGATTIASRCSAKQDIHLARHHLGLQRRADYRLWRAKLPGLVGWRRTLEGRLQAARKIVGDVCTQGRCQQLALIAKLGGIIVEGVRDADRWHQLCAAEAIVLHHVGGGRALEYEEHNAASELGRDLAQHGTRGAGEPRRRQRLRHKVGLGARPGPCAPTSSRRACRARAPRSTASGSPSSRPSSPAAGAPGRRRQPRVAGARPALPAAHRRAGCRGARSC
eukprot:scaffold68315_cov68-Phaeocystis_antarctica.AAC.1